MLDSGECKDICGIAASIAREAGQRIRKLTPRQRHISFKGRRDMVTEVDQASESLILEALGRHFPDHNVLAEESGSRDSHQSEFIWYIDPLDGTTNFVHGFPAYSVSLGLSQQTQLMVGVIYDPVHDELFTAWHQGGAQLNGRSIAVSAVGDLGHSLLATGFPYTNDEDFKRNMRLWQGIYGKTQGLRRAGSAALDLAYVAAGRLDGFWEYGLNPWDHAAGALLVTEAGGVVTRVDATDFLPEHRDILAANPVLHPRLAAAIRCVLNPV